MGEETLIFGILGLVVICFTLFKIIDRVLRFFEIIKGARKVDNDFSSLKVSLGGQDDEEE